MEAKAKDKPDIDCCVKNWNVFNNMKQKRKRNQINLSMQLRK